VKRLVWMAAALMILACGTPVADPEPSSTADERDAPVRVASLVPYVSDAVAQLAADGAAVELVAAVTPTVPGHRPLAGSTADLGSPHSPSHEILAGARPDLVVGNGRLHTALVQDLERSGGEVLLLGGGSVEETLTDLSRLGERLGVTEAMDGRVAEVRADLDDLRLEEPVEVLALFGAPGSFLAVTSSTWLGDLLGRLGFDNPVTAGGGRETYPGYVQLSDEVLASLEPDRVLLVTHGEPEAVRELFDRQVARGGPWAGLAERAVVLPPELFGDNPGLALGAAARHLVGLIDSPTGREGR
jgi:iron complex transport system substrate-binding protein